MLITGDWRTLDNKSPDLALSCITFSLSESSCALLLTRLTHNLYTNPIYIPPTHTAPVDGDGAPSEAQADGGEGGGGQDRQG